MLNENSLYKLFKELKYKEDFIIVHPDLLSFYKFKVKIEKFWEILNKALGRNKTYIFPTFNFINKKVWSCSDTKSETGSLTEFIRVKHSVKRTTHPIHSVCVVGPKYNEIAEHNCSSSFGKNSTWEWLCENQNVRSLALGIDFSGGATLCHYPEEKLNVFYRAYKNLNIKVYDQNNKVIKRKYTYFARKKNYENLWDNCKNQLIKNKIIVNVKNEFKIPIFSMNALETTNFITSNLEKNNKFVLKSN